MTDDLEQVPTPRSTSMLMSIQDIAADLRISVSHARQNIVTHSKFPKAVLIPGGGKRPLARWHRDEVEDHLAHLPRDR